ncbi:MAG: VanZ family protein [Desulfobacteraceae bacterium]|nr:MAG: VanZ family protein [Desulfobacteraceae bacterium]
MERNRPKTDLFRTLLLVTATVILFLATTPREIPVVSGFNDKFNHVLAFLVLAGLADKSFPETKSSLKKMLPLLGYGILIECIQYFIPWRMFSLYDVAADAAGLIVYQAAITGFNKFRTKNLKK